MSIGYDEDLLLRLFKNEPLIFDQEICNYLYSINNRDNYRLKLELSVYEENAELSLYHNSESIYWVDVQRVVDIVAEGDQLKIFRENATKPTVYVTGIPDQLPFSTEIDLTSASAPFPSFAASDGAPIKYDDFDLMVLFCQEAQVIDPIEKILEYNIRDDYGHQLIVRFGLLDHTVQIVLTLREKTIYKVQLDEITQLKVERDDLLIFREKFKKESPFEPADPIVRLAVVPHFKEDKSLFSVRIHV